MASKSVLAACLGLLGVANAAAGEPPMLAARPWPAITGLDAELDHDLSGLACGPDRGGRRGCVLVSDEKRRVIFATLTTTADAGFIEAGPTMAVLEKTRFDRDGKETKNAEADLEAVARDGDVYWVFGSHSTKRTAKGATDCAPEPARRHLYRFAVDPKTDRPAFAFDAETPPPQVLRLDRLADALAGIPELAGAAIASLCADDGGFNIEGAAVVAGRMTIGLRAPLAADGATAYAVSLDAEGLATGRDAHAKLHRLPLGAGFGIRDLAPVAGGFLVLAGPSTSDDGGHRPASTLWFWSGGDKPPVAIGRLGDTPKKGKPEGLTLLSETAAGWRVLVIHDGVSGGAPLEYRAPRH